MSMEAGGTRDVLRTVHGKVLRSVHGNVLRSVLGNVLRSVLRNILRNVIGNVLRNVLWNVLRNVLGNVLGNVQGNVLGNASESSRFQCIRYVSILSHLAFHNGHPWDPTNWLLYTGGLLIEFALKLVTVHQRVR